MAEGQVSGSEAESGVPAMFRSPAGLRRRDYYTSPNHDGLQEVGMTGWHDCLAYGEDLGVASHPSGA
jgi:hypothetical protein